MSERQKKTPDWMIERLALGELDAVTAEAVRAPAARRGARARRGAGGNRGVESGDPGGASRRGGGGGGCSVAPQARRTRLRLAGRDAGGARGRGGGGADHRLPRPGAAAGRRRRPGVDAHQGAGAEAGPRLLRLPSRRRRATRSSPTGRPRRAAICCSSPTRPGRRLGRPAVDRRRGEGDRALAREGNAAVPLARRRRVPAAVVLRARRRPGLRAFLPGSLPTRRSTSRQSTRRRARCPDARAPDGPAAAAPVVPAGHFAPREAP